MLTALFMMVTAAAASEEVGYEIGAGDVVQIKVHRAEFGETEFKVSEGGEISFPYVGRVKLAGMSAFEAEEHMISVLKDGYLVNPEVTIRVQNHSSQRIEVLGNVKKPGVYNLSRTTTLRGLITQAGGAAPGGTVRVNRGEEIIEIGSSELDGPRGEFLVQGEDVVSVINGEKVYLSGEVANEGSIPYRRNLTASQALLEVGGASNFALLGRAYIVRGTERIKVNLRAILRGRRADVPLMPGDRIVVPTNPL